MSALQQTLAQLRDIHPGPPPALPTATGEVWWLLALLPVLALGLLLWRCGPLLRAGWRLYDLQRYHHGLQRCHPHADTAASPQQAGYTGIAGLNGWLKASTLLVYSRQEIAALHGESWLQWLAGHSSTTWLFFSERWSGWLYAGQPASAQEYRQVWQLCRRWWVHLLWRRLCWH